jgi:hypothetical protein
LLKDGLIDREVEENMKIRNKVLRALGLILFFAGSLLGTIAFGGLSWASLESHFYFGYGAKGETSLHLTCPRLLTYADKAPQITAEIKNTTDFSYDPQFQTDISNVLLVRTIRGDVPLSPQQTVLFHWGLTDQDVVFGHLILTHVFQYRSAQLLSAEAYCGIVFLGLAGLTGDTVLVLILLGTVLGMGCGMALWIFNRRSLEGISRELRMGMLFLAGVVGLGMIVGWFGLWIPGALLLAISIILILVLVTRYVISPGQI